MRAVHVQRRIHTHGITLPELLVVVSVIGMAVAVAVPLVSSAILSAQLRSATDQYRVSLQAARMIAVSRQGPVTVSVLGHPDNRYEYADTQGRTRISRIPPGICIAVATASSVTFEANGSIDEEISTIFTTTRRQGASTLCELSGGVDSFEVRTNLLGESTVTRETFD